MTLPLAVLFFAVGAVVYVVLVLVFAALYHRLMYRSMRRHVDTAPIDIPPLEPYVHPDFAHFVRDVIAQAYEDTTIYRRLYRLPGETRYKENAS
jgi:hypothetical protein